MNKQFLKQNEIFKKVPKALKKAVEIHFEQIIEDRNVHLGIDEYTKKVIICNPSRSIDTLKINYQLMICKNLTESEEKDKYKKETKSIITKPSFISIFSHVASLKELSAFALKNIIDEQFFTDQTILPQDLKPFVAAIGITEPLLLGSTVEVIID